VRRPIAIAAIAIALVTAACASNTGDQPPTADGTLHVTQRVHGHLYIEGSIGSIKVLRGNRTVYESKIGNGVTKDLPPGHYELDSYQQLCTGNCGNLGPPTDRCSRSIEISSDATTSAVVELTPDSNSCTISTS